jgi:hypothetical protein
MPETAFPTYSFPSLTSLAAVRRETCPLYPNITLKVDIFRFIPRGDMFRGS